MFKSPILLLIALVATLGAAAPVADDSPTQLVARGQTAKKVVDDGGVCYGNQAVGIWQHSGAGTPSVLVCVDVNGNRFYGVKDRYGNRGTRPTGTETQYEAAFKSACNGTPGCTSKTFIRVAWSNA